MSLHNTTINIQTLRNITNPSAPQFNTHCTLHNKVPLCTTIQYTLYPAQYSTPLHHNSIHTVPCTIKYPLHHNSIHTVPCTVKYPSALQFNTHCTLYNKVPLCTTIQYTLYPAQ